MCSREAVLNNRALQCVWQLSSTWGWVVHELRIVVAMAVALNHFLTPERPFRKQAASFGGSSSSTSPWSATQSSTGEAVLPVHESGGETSSSEMRPKPFDPRDAALNDISYLETLVMEDQQMLEDEREQEQDDAQVKRVRLRYKQRPPMELAMVSRSRSPSLEIGSRELLKKARVQFGCERARSRGHGVRYRDAFADAGAEWMQLSPAERQPWIDMAKASLTERGGVLPAPHVMTEPPEDVAGHHLHYSPGLLCTWNSGWLLNDQEYVALVKKWINCPHVLSSVLQDVPCVKKLFQSLKEVVQRCTELFKCRDYSCCLEISLNSEDVGRCHLHAFIERRCREDKAWAKWSTMLPHLAVEGAKVSHSNPCCSATRGRNRCRQLCEGHYYCQARKLGHVMHFSTAPIWESIFPDSRMVMTLWRTRKMSTSVAKEDVLHTRDRAPTVIQALDATMALEYGAEMDREVASADMAWKKCPFVQPCELELEWCRQFAVTAMKPHMSMCRCRDFVSNQHLDESFSLRRFKFLVYDGPSRMGKTELAMSWFGPANTLCVNAQDTVSPNLRPMQSGRYSAIVFDEGNWELAAANKAMFQSSSRSVELSQSQCNDRCYRVLLFRVPLIICSNSFWAGCKDPEITDWIVKNSCYVKVEKPVFIQEDT